MEADADAIVLWMQKDKDTTENPKKRIGGSQSSDPLNAEQFGRVRTENHIQEMETTEGCLDPTVQYFCRVAITGTT